MGIFFDTKEQLTFYSAYHHNKVNQWIHICCVPIIFWTAATFFSELMIGDISAAWIVGLLYCIFYCMLDFPVGLVMSVLIYFAVSTAIDFTKDVPSPYHTTIGIHVFAWVMQFIGHGVFERRAPSLFTSFFQSLFMAPFFVFMEVLFMFGFKKELHNEVNAKVVVELTKLREEKKAH